MASKGMEEPQDPALAAGSIVGGYRIEYALGAGGMGTVYAAIEPTIGKRVAIKVLRRVYADDARLAARFEREARAANDISHPGIIDIFAFGRLDDGRLYFRQHNEKVQVLLSRKGNQKQDISWLRDQ